jgi:NTP pyrophosphatase (non-canonical NTP hydrolase)
VEFKKYLKTHKEDFADELGDVLNYLVQLSHATGVDLLKAANEKIGKNAKKYPVSKAKGSAKKYNQY